MKAKVARYYGWSAWHLENLPFALFMEYYKAIDVLTSEEQLLAIQVAVSPKLKREKWKELVSKHQRTIKSGVDRTEGRPANIQDVAKAFARMKMNG